VDSSLPSAPTESTAGPASEADWLRLTATPIPVDAVSAWVVRPDCGAVVVFTGVVRDHAEGRSGVTELTYEAYEEFAVARMADVVAEARRLYPTLGKVAILHRVGRLDVSDTAVIVAVSAPHRAEAFDAARYCIDAVKAAVPIWKHERWTGGEGWGTNAMPLDRAVGAPTAATSASTTTTTTAGAGAVGRDATPADEPTGLVP
jgi:molybdopterin synthase catalytic subunit